MTFPRLRPVAALSLAFLLAACSASDSSPPSAPDGVGASPDGASPDTTGGPSKVDGGGGPTHVVDPFEATSLIPAKGLTTGGDPITIVGSGFEDPVEVLISGALATNPIVVDGSVLSIITPAGVVGPADVEVRNGDGLVALLKGGFLYYDAFGVEAVSPQSGPVSGGTALTVKGYGFVPESVVMIGNRVAIGSKIVDDHTILCIAPASEEPGKVPVRVTTPAGVASLERAYEYVAPLAVTGVSPGAGFTTGGETVAITGTGLFGEPDDVAVFLGAAEVEITAIAEDGSRIEILTPPHGAGSVDVTVSVGGQELVLWSGFTFVDADALGGPTKILSVSPSQGPRTGGTAVTIVANGVTSITDVKVRFGAISAKPTAIDPDHGALEVLTPLSDVGVVDITLESSAGVDVAEGAFEFLATPWVQNVAPAEGPATGGTTVTIEGTGFTGVTGVWFDALAASSVEVLDDATMRVVTPPGSPGPVDIRVSKGPLESLAKGAFTYKWGKIQILAVEPDAGPMGGGTVVHLYGTDLPESPIVYFGLDKSVKASFVSAAHLTATSTGAETPQTVDVSLRDGDGNVLSTLPDAYSYYNPAAAQGGTWGAPVTGTVNVSVLDVFSQQGVEGAYVVLGGEVESAHQGYTDWLGQITFNGPDLKGPQRASAWHPEYSGSSIVEFDAENVTILLFPLHPPAGGGGGGGGSLDLPSTVAGHVSIYEKYLIPPPGTCEGKKDPQGVLCAKCQDDSECKAPENLCTPMVNGQSYCTTPCETGVGCPSGYACMAVVLGETKRCMPVAGQTRVVCGTTMADVLTPTPDPGAGKIANENGDFKIDTRQGALAVVCRAELYDQSTGGTVPLSMGASQPVYVEPGDAITGVEVKLDVPTNRDIAVQFDYPPSRLLALPLHRMRTLLSFGEAGVLELARTEVKPGEGSFELDRLPKSLSASLSGTSYLVIGGAFTNDSWLDWWNASAIPISATILRDLPDLAAENLYAPAEPTWKPAPADIGPLHALWAAPSGAITGVGSDGLIVKRTGTSWELLGAPLKTDWLDVWGRADDDALAVGASGALIHWDGFTWKQVGATGFTPTALSGLGASSVLIVGEGGQAARWNNQELEPLQLAKATLRDVWAAPSGEAWVVGDGGVALLVSVGGTATNITTGATTDLLAVAGSAQGDVLMAGRFGALWRLNAGEEELHKLASGTTEDLHGLWMSADGETAVAVGSRGTVLRIEGDSVVSLSVKGAGVRLLDVVGDATEPLLAAGEDALLFGPLLELPEFAAPISDGSLVNRTIAWGTQGGPISDLNYIQLGAQWWSPLWNMVTDGAVETVQIPDYNQLVGQSNLKGAGVYLQINRLLVTGFDIDAFEFYVAFFPELWDAWAINNTYVTITNTPSPD